MKFRSPDTNQIFVDIYDAHADFCNDRDCDTDCPLVETALTDLQKEVVLVEMAKRDKGE